MRLSPRFAVTALAVSLALLAGCNKADEPKGEAKADAAASADADAIPGLPTEKDRNSYMVGMALGRQFEPMKDELDIDVVVKAIKTTLAGEKLLMTDEQAQAIGEGFQRKLQARQIEKMMADASANAEAGAKFLAENAKKPGVVTTDSGLQYLVIEPGKGDKPTAEDTVRVNYKGSLLDGTVFDDSAQHGGAAEFPLAQVVPGWQEGIVLMPVGSKYRFWIPSELGYGETGTPGGPIPPNSTLVFEVELLDIVDKAP
ncbi:FKBP-type peptidyl-prolyl cis-trans isomerase [Luteimonas sp. 8-5]|uniref:FKBP-type peptidyl-prolyl cis-trans isomerase n=1 Tax=Luteimonas sp. 8-5 TaxID=3039387 RepID=UPI0024364601|nr:FKBP-type peptidyl-prolyl cis-trans isomerase [Luteimonas sp. 8-5]MDG6348245.1 FKBP-type peptidyl-prolyl cis-trans isomerase [Luteimonas sp. 8-5]